MLSYSLLGLALASAASASRKCRCLSTDPCFPSRSQWNTFARSLSQPLIANQRPLASPCYPTSQDYSPSACAAATTGHLDDDFLATSSNALQYTNFESVLTNTSIQGCGFDVAPNSTCFQGRVPTYSINATTVADVQSAVRFAAQHNLRLVVKNTGHDFMGRAFGVGAVELFTGGLQGANFSDSFVPAGARHSTPGQSAVTIGSGMLWGDVYRLVNDQNHTVVGGFSRSVGAGGGWPTGAGHSVMSSHYGLGVDNTLQYTVVLPNASHVTANSYQNADLFWALRGGGAPSFGIVTSITYRTHPNLPYTAAFYTATANSSSSYHQLLETWVGTHNAIADAGWSGPWPFSNGSLFLTMVTPGTPASPAANTTMQAFFDASRQIPGVNVSLAMSVEYASWYEFFYNNLVDPSRGFGLNFAQQTLYSVQASWLMPRELTAPENAATLAGVLTQIGLGLPFLDAGGVVGNVSVNATSITPAWRNTVSDMTLAANFDQSSTAAEVQAAIQSVHAQIQPIRDLAPPPTGGQYINEPDILLEDWQEAQWASNYPRLRAIKKAIDPNDLLIIRHGVNSEGWDDEIICKTT
ncbi:hypothetical protein EWM64_g6152 [Hericium alpestre]|uniref:FAD-binding PCMH-type domain-containing protein n=1 Tax=Hericium alpestre TaxID=135208 RepID=A0A4Y9ZUE5_9AGAM|nr:hypothetical protein EWM64_g6152 [Hericium alpestre]